MLLPEISLMLSLPRLHLRKGPPLLLLDRLKMLLPSLPHLQLLKENILPPGLLLPDPALLQLLLPLFDLVLQLSHS
jgi:hypothetical protein